MKRLKSVAILALGPTFREYFRDYERNDGRFTQEVWTVNRGASWFRDIDMVFAMDDVKRLRAYRKKAHDRIMDCGVPVMTATAYPEWPALVEFPHEAVLKFLGPHPSGRRLWLDNSLTYAIAYALYRGAKDIYLYGYDFFIRDPRTLGVEMEEGEPDWHRFYRENLLPKIEEPGVMGVAYLIGWAAARGVNVHIAQGSTLLDADLPPFLYGYQEQPE